MNDLTAARRAVTAEFGYKMPTLGMNDLIIHLRSEVLELEDAEGSAEFFEEMGDILHTLHLMCDISGVDICAVEKSAIFKFSNRWAIVKECFQAGFNFQFAWYWAKYRDDDSVILCVHEAWIDANSALSILEKGVELCKLLEGLKLFRADDFSYVEWYNDKYHYGALYKGIAPTLQQVMDASPVLA